MVRYVVWFDDWEFDDNGGIDFPTVKAAMKAAKSRFISIYDEVFIAGDDGSIRYIKRKR